MKVQNIYLGKSTITWKEVLFSEVFKILRNNSLSRAELSENNGKVKNIHYGDILIKFNECIYADKKENIPYIANDDIAYKLLKSSPLKNGDVVFADAAEDNTVGKCSEIIMHKDVDLVAGLHTIPCRPVLKFAEGYLGYYLNSNLYHNQLLQYIQGSKVSSISKKSLNQTIIRYPKEKINQQKIASYFEALDSQIVAITKKLESLKHIKAASLQSMFPQEGETTPKVRFKEFKGEWDSPTIDYVFELRNGYTPSKAIKEYWENGTIPWFRMEDIRAKGSILSEAFQNITPRAVKGSGLFKPNSIILATTATIGVHAMLIADSLANQRFTNFTIRKSLYDRYIPDFVNYAFYKIDSWSEKNTNSGGLLSVDIHSLIKQPFLTPSIEEQQKIASYFTNLDHQINLQSKRLEKLKQIKAACLDKMFV